MVFLIVQFYFIYNNDLSYISISYSIVLCGNHSTAIVRAKILK